MSVFDLAGSIGAGQALGARQTEIRRTNALADLYREQGPGIMRGDPAAMNALAQMDPMAAFDMNRLRQADTRAEQTLNIDRERLRLAEEQGARAATEHAARMSEFERTATINDMTDGYGKLRLAIEQGPEQFEAMKQQFAPMFAEQGIDISGLTYDQGPEVLSGMKGFLRVLGVDVGQTQKRDTQFIKGVGIADMQTGEVISDLGGAAGALGDGFNVQSSVILDDGTTVLVGESGERRVIAPDGTAVEGQAAADAIRDARDYTVRNQRDIYAGRREGTNVAEAQTGAAAAAAGEVGKQTVQQGVSAYEALGKVNANIGTIQTAIAAIDAGAKAGAVERYFPNITAASAELQNAMDRLGLDVIGSVTFGALSEGEMRLAMEVAVPRSLDEKALRDWLVRKQAAQQKAADALYNAARYLTTPGNTLDGWISQNPPQRAPAGQQGAQAGPPDFSAMSDEELRAWISKAENR